MVGFTSLVFLDVLHITLKLSLKTTTQSSQLNIPIILQGSAFVAYLSLVCSPTKNRQIQAPKTSQNPKGSGATAGHYVWSLIEWQEGKPQEIASLTQGIIIVPSQPSPPNVTLPRNNGLIRGIGWPAMILRDHGGLHILLKAGYPSVSSCGLGLVGNFPLGYFGCIPVIHCWFRFCVFLEAILERVMNSVWNHSLLIGPCRMYKLRNWSSSHLYMHRFFAPRLLLFLTLKPAHISTLQKGPGWCFPPTKESVVLSHYRGQYAWRSIVVEAFVGCGGPWRWDFQNPGGKE